MEGETQTLVGNQVTLVTVVAAVVVVATAVAVVVVVVVVVGNGGRQGKARLGKCMMVV